jgi:YhcH/YjgK/YiaL family protein
MPPTMIFDRLDRIALYRTLTPNLRTAIDWLAGKDLKALELAKFEISGTDVFAIPQSYQTKAESAAKWESHRRYIDIQIMVDGSERMDVADLSTMSDATVYDEKKDAILFSGTTGTSLPLVVNEGQFAIFFPHDAHRPTVAVDAPTTIRKVVLKVAV